MPFDTRCPDCSTKLRLDEAPRPGEEVECPKCGLTFAPVRAKPKAAAAAARPAAPRRPRDEDEADDRPAKPAKRGGIKPPKSIKEQKTANPNNKGVKRKARKKVTNPFFLLAAIGFGFLVLAAVFLGMIYYLGRAGKVEEMMTYVPAQVNWVRGVNVTLLSKYPGYSTEMDKFYTSDIKSAAEHLAKAAGNDTADALDYLLIAKQRDSASSIGTQYVLRMREKMEPGALAAGLGATESPVNGERAFKLGGTAPGVLANALVIFPTERIAVVLPPGRMQSAMATASTVGKDGKGESFATHLNPTGRKVIAGTIWLLMRNTGHYKDYLADSFAPVKGDFAKLLEAGKGATMFGVWTSPGGSGVRVGAAIECADADAAKALVKYFEEGPLGKGDESEPTNELKKASLQFVTNKRVFGEFAQYLEFRRTGTCAYLVSKVTGENAKTTATSFNNPSMGLN